MAQKSEMLVKEFVSKSPVIDVEKRQIRFLASTPDVDRDGERILPTAFGKNLAQFLTNSVFLACHQHRLDSGDPPVIGKVVRAWIDAAVGLWAIVQFAENELGEKYWKLYRDGFMKAVSVGFTPIKWHEEFIEGKRVTTYDEVEWIELSACAVPSNRGALSRSKQRKQDFIADKKSRHGTVSDEQLIEELKEKGEWPTEEECLEYAEQLGESSENDVELDFEPNYGAIAKGQSSTEFYNE
jgi:HK97 family phage prohead protease